MEPKTYPPIDPRIPNTAELEIAEQRKQRIKEIMKPVLEQMPVPYAEFHELEKRLKSVEETLEVVKGILNAKLKRETGNDNVGYSFTK